jgi:hypothetical protein
MAKFYLYKRPHISHLASWKWKSRCARKGTSVSPTAVGSEAGFDFDSLPRRTRALTDGTGTLGPDNAGPNASQTVRDPGLADAGHSHGPGFVSRKL